VGDDRNPDEDEGGQREDVDHPGHGPQDHHVDVPAVDALAGGDARGADEVPDGAPGVVPPEPDAAQLVHGPAVGRIQGKRPLLVLPRRVQIAAGQAYLAGEEVHVGLVRREGARLLGRGRGDVEPPRAERGLGHADVGLPVPRREPARLVAGPQRLSVVVGVQQRVAGQPVRPLIRGIQRHRAVGGVNGLLVAARPEVSTGQQAPCPRVLGLGRDQAGEQATCLVVAFHVQHRVGPREFLPDFDHVSGSMSPGRWRQHAVHGRHPPASARGSRSASPCINMRFAAGVPGTGAVI
jgi:hypothetical protein